MSRRATGFEAGDCNQVTGTLPDMQGVCRLCRALVPVSAVRPAGTRASLPYNQNHKSSRAFFLVFKVSNLYNVFYTFAKSL